MAGYELQTEVRCPRNHVLVRFETERCDGGHTHRVYCCPMRLGSRSCGQMVVVPPRGPACHPDDDRDRSPGDGE